MKVSKERPLQGWMKILPCSTGPSPLRPVPKRESEGEVESQCRKEIEQEEGEDKRVEKEGASVVEREGEQEDQMIKDVMGESGKTGTKRLEKG